MAKEIVIKSRGVSVIKVPLVGITPLISHRFSEESIDKLVNKVTQKAKTGRKKKDFHKEYMATLYLFEDQVRTGIPSVAFRDAMIQGGKGLDYNMTDIRRNVLIVPDGHSQHGALTEIHGRHEMFLEPIRLPNGSANMSSRAIFREWSCEVTIRYTNYSAEEIISILNAGGMVGVGARRPGKSNTGSYGVFEVDHNRTIS